MKSLYICALPLLLSACATTTLKPQTAGELQSGFTYIPLDPFAVETEDADSCSVESGPTGAGVTRKQKALLEALPDNAVRVSIESLDTDGKVSYGTSFLSSKNQKYRVTVDYVNVDTTNVSVWISKRMQNYRTKKYEQVPLLAPASNDYTYNSEIYSVTRSPPAIASEETYAEFSIPVYVGVGLRVTANINSANGKANISGLGVIGAEAEANRIQGTLVVQTLGINGKSIAAALPIQSELNRTTAQNAVVAIGAIKALLYEDETVKSPRVVGLYLPFPGGKPLVNAIISELSKKRVPWRRPCSFKAITESG